MVKVKLIDDIGGKRLNKYLHNTVICIRSAPLKRMSPAYLNRYALPRHGVALI